MPVPVMTCNRPFAGPGIARLSKKAIISTDPGLRDGEKGNIPVTRIHHPIPSGSMGLFFSEVGQGLLVL